MKYEIFEKGKIKKTNKLAKRKEKKDLSIVIPTYNERENIEKLVRTLKNTLNQKIDYEIIIVDDNSIDGSKEILKNLSKEKEIVVLERLSQKGIFTAVKDGVKISRSKYIQTMDSDFSHPPKKINEFWKFRKGYNIISGSRFIKNGRFEAPFLRKYGSLFLNKICAFILGVDVRDVGGNFHLMKKKDFEKLDLKKPSSFGEFSFELFYKAKKKKMSVKEIPFHSSFRQEGNSKMGGNNLKGILKTSLKYLKRAFELRFF